MAKVFHCDICKRETEEIVGKIFLTPLGPGRSANGFHVNYSHHADVGVCCFDKLLSGFNFQKRKTAREYHDSRRKSTSKKS